MLKKFSKQLKKLSKKLKKTFNELKSFIKAVNTLKNEFHARQST